MISEMIIEVGHEHIEDHASPKVDKVRHGISPIASERVRNLEIAVHLAVSRVEHAHCRQERHPLFGNITLAGCNGFPIEPPNEKDVLFSHSFYARE